jgi:hypothetical protein
MPGQPVDATQVGESIKGCRVISSSNHKGFDETSGIGALTFDHPFDAWLFPLGDENLQASLVTFSPQIGRSGHVDELLAVLPAEHPLCDSFARDPAAILLVSDASSQHWPCPRMAIGASIWIERAFPSEIEATPAMQSVHAQLTRLLPLSGSVRTTVPTRGSGEFL